MSTEIPPPPPKTVLVIALDHSVSYNENARLDKWYENLCTMLRHTCKVYGAVISGTALMFLDDTHYKFDAVVVTDPVIMSRRNDYPALSDKLVSYVEAGGRLIFSPYCRLGFGSSVQATDVDSYMERVWGFRWTLSTAEIREFKLNDQAVFENKEYWLKVLAGRNMFAVQLDGPRIEERLYIDSHGEGSPAIFAPYGRGHVCWVGDVLLHKATVWIIIVLGNLRVEEPQDNQPATPPNKSITSSDSLDSKVTNTAKLRLKCAR